MAMGVPFICIPQDSQPTLLVLLPPDKHLLISAHEYPQVLQKMSHILQCHPPQSHIHGQERDQNFWDYTFA